MDNTLGDHTLGIEEDTLYVTYGGKEIALQGAKCDEYVCVLSEEAKKVFDELNCRVFIRRSFAEVFIYDQVLRRSNIYYLCRSGKIRCIKVPSSERKNRLFVCVDDVILYALLRAGRNYRIDDLYRFLRYVLIYLLYQCVDIDTKRVSMVSDMIVEKAREIIERYGLKHSHR